MAEQSASDRTEQATPERLRRARKEGKIPVSQELPSALMMVMLLVVLAMAGSSLFDWSLRMVRDGLSFSPGGSFSQTTIGHLMFSRTVSAILAVMPFLIGAAVASVVGSLLVSGWSVSTSAMKIDFSKLNIINGFKQMFSAHSAVGFVVSLAKMGVIGWIVWSYLQGRMAEILNLASCPAAQVAATSGTLVFGLLIRLAVGLGVIAAADVLYQRWHYMRQMRMTLQEVKEERRNYELSPEVKGRIRRLQIEMVKKRMFQEVPKADVVLANPTHVAVALRYQTGMAAPQVVAKGADVLAEKIKEIARQSNVPVIYRPELARTIFRGVEVGETVPEALYVAVAEILALVYRLGYKRKQLTTTQVKA